jgi:hypothetical protein
MGKFIKRLLLFFSFFLLFFVVKELVSFYSLLVNINPWFAYVVFSLIGAATIYMVGIPLYKIFTLPVNPSPALDKKLELRVIEKRMARFRKSEIPQLQVMAAAGLSNTREDYDKVIKILNKESEKIRKKYVSQVFYRTGIIQNGFIDALLILSSGVSMIREIFILYNGRVSNRDVWRIMKQVYYSMLIGGSEAAEYATQEIFSKFASDSIKGIPFIDKVMTSLTDGLVNAALMTRVALITENYCSKSYVESYRELYPSAKFIFQTAKSITSNIVTNVFNVMKGMGSEKSVDIMLKAGNPVGYIFEKAIDLAFHKSEEESALRKNLKTGARFIGNPIIYGIEKLVQKSRTRKKQLEE